MRAINGFDSTPLGKLAPSIEQMELFRFARKEKLTDTSEERKVLLEDYRSGFITANELQQELKQLKAKHE